MRPTAVRLAAIILAATLASCSRATADTTVQPGADQMENVLLAEWTGPYGGVPAFDKMDLAALEPAVVAGMEAHLAELDEISNNPDPPTFENTIVAMERAGKPVRRAFTYFGIWRGNLSTPEAREIAMELAPKRSEYSSKIIQNERLFARIKAVYESKELASRSASDQRLVKRIYDRFAREGAALEGDKKKRYAEIQKRLAELQTKFSNNVLADEEKYVVYLSEDQLGGLPESLKAAAAAAAESRGQKGKYAITNTRSSMDPFLTYSDERELREKVWRNYYNRGDNGDENDNNAIIVEILKLRDERVALLGFEDFATWKLEDRMAKTPAAVMELLEKIWTASVTRAKQEVKDMQALAKKEGRKITIEPWDYRYYADKVRKAKYDLDSNEVKQYLQLDKLREAMFMVANEVFALKFTPIPEGEVPVFHPDVKVWEVTDRDSGELVGLWYMDPFARKGKQSGAWASSYRRHSTFDGKQTVLSSNNCNFIKAAPGKPVLVSWDDATTMFHEFGHALHSLTSKVVYRSQNGGLGDFTEFQSQLLERWLLTDRVINEYLVHYETGKPMPPELVAKIKKAAKFNQGFETTEYLASALMDMKFHTADPEGLDPDKFERETLEELGLPREIVMRHRSPHFGHVFSSEGYATGYYGYIWADVLTSDAAEAFAEAPGGFYDKALAKKLVDHLFSTGDSVDPAEAYRAFRGRDANIDALMRDRGFPVK